MGSVKLNDWLQVVGLFALVGSLVFVGLQMRQTHEIALVTLYQMRSDAARDLMAAQRIYLHDNTLPILPCLVGELRYSREEFRGCLNEH